MAHPGGRPTIYSEEMVELVCHEIATNARGLDHICASNPNMPGSATIKTWMKKHPEFRAQYLKAKEIQALLFMEKSICVADRDEVEDSDSLIRINRDKLKIDLYKFQAARLSTHYAEKREYKDKIDLTIKEHKETEENINSIKKQYEKDA